jgi:hypothetical protein
MMGWEIGWFECNNQPLLISILLVIEAMGGGGDVKSEDTTITFSRGCSKPLAVDHTTINIKSKGSGRWAVNVSNENTSNAKQQSTV